MADERLEHYKNIVCAISYELALISLVASHAEKGKLTDAAVVVDGLKNADRLRETYLEARKSIGLSDRGAYVAFTDDHFFQDFKLRGGRMEGCLESVEHIAGKWNLKHLPTEDEATRYEVGVYCLMYAGAAQSVFVALKEDEEADDVPEEPKKESGIRKVTSDIINFVSAKLKKNRKKAA